MSGAKASRVGSPALAQTRLLLRNVWSPKRNRDVVPHSDPPTDSVPSHQGSWRRKPRNYFHSAEGKCLPGPLPSPVPLCLSWACGTCGSVLITSPCSTVKELCSPDAKCGKIFSDPIHKGTGRQAPDKTGFGGKYSPSCFTETFVPWSRSGVNRNSETSDLKAGYQGMFCMGPVHVQHAYF